MVYYKNMSISDAVYYALYQVLLTSVNVISPPSPLITEHIIHINNVTEMFPFHAESSFLRDGNVLQRHGDVSQFGVVSQVHFTGNDDPLDKKNNIAS